MVYVEHQRNFISKQFRLVFVISLVIVCATYQYFSVLWGSFRDIQRIGTGLHDSRSTLVPSPARNSSFRLSPRRLIFPGGCAMGIRQVSAVLLTLMFLSTALFAQSA